ncbi:MAG: thioredoxin domain-containing protein [Armatimonadetes bacterium]|nr:thioredoxin domain-containing protein [Armatimonadota bacterium]
MNTEKSQINWREWSPDVLKLAEREDKPILLAITAAWCHWCHVMDHTTFENAEVADAVNQWFVPVRADTDRRPDLNTRFNMGGWPTVAFLTPEGDVLTGATYLPPRQTLDLLKRIADVYTERRSELTARAAEIRKEQQKTAETESTGLFTENIPESIMRTIEGSFDPVHGGFGTQQKFPHTPALELLLYDFRRTGNRSHLDMLTTTLDAMRSGGLFDPVEGGFFRYSTTRDWSMPHYEKMLEDNSALLSIYIQAYGITGNANYLQTARLIMNYLEKTLYDEDKGAFYGSQDADEEYYELPEEERKKRKPPSVDKTAFVNWNGLAADAYLRTYEIVGDRAYLDRALGALDFLTRCCHSHDGETAWPMHALSVATGIGHEDHATAEEGGCFHHYFDDGPKGFGLLTDQIPTGRALIRAFECTGDRRFLRAARSVGECIVSLFADPVGGFFDISEEWRKAEGLPYREKLLDENAQAARFLNRLSYYTHEPHYRRAAEIALRSLVSEFEPYGILAAPYALAVAEVLEEPVRVAITGSRADPKTEELLARALKSKSPSSTIEMLEPGTPEEEARRLGIEPSEEPKAAVCIRESCRVASDPAEIGPAIREAESKKDR